MEPVKSCHNCEHGTFDTVWGDYACKLFNRRILIGVYFADSDCSEHDFKKL